MDRRTALQSLLSVGAYFAAPKLTYGTEDQITDYGARPSPRPYISKAPRFYDRFAPFKGISTLGRNVFLYQNLQREIGEIIPHYQGPAPDGSPGEGDCVGQATAMGCDVLAASDIHLLKQSEEWKAKASVEMIYAGSRIEIGQTESGTNHLRGRGGSHGGWAARYVRDYGVLHRLKYQKDGNAIDLEGYHPDRSRQYRDQGVPDWLEAIAREHPVKEITNVRSGKEALDAVCSGQPVVICSSYAFPPVRDSDGFTTPYLGTTYKRGWKVFSARVQWWHAMVLTAAILEGGRIGGTIQNSHGPWNEGPRPNNMPEGSFNVEIQYLDLMVQDWYDCWALGSYEGHKSKKIRHKLYLR